MKIALISPYSSQNYGTVLQAFALAYVLKKKGCDCEYINYNPWGGNGRDKKLKFYIKHPFAFISERWTRYINRKDLHYNHLGEKWFESVQIKNKEFVKANTPVASEMYSYDTRRKLKGRYDKIIIGSDQTWSPFHELFYSVFFLDYHKYAKYYSYAPSLGTIKPSSLFLKFLSYKISKMNYASCREVCNSIEMSKRCNREVKCVLDPTLLISHTEWEPYMSKVEGMPAKFVLCYILGEKKEISEMAEKYGKEKELPVYYIVTRPIYRDKQHPLESVGVKEFLWLIDHSACVFTDSFHCTIFSINFNRDFYCFDKMSEESYDNGRLLDVLRQFNLCERLQKNRIVNEFKTDYSCVNNILHKKRIESMDYINQVLKD